MFVNLKSLIKMRVVTDNMVTLMTQCVLSFRMFKSTSLFQPNLWETCQKRKFKPLINTFKTVKILSFFSLFTIGRTDSKWTKYCNFKAFCKFRKVYSHNQWNYFQRGCMDKWRSGDFSIQTWCIPLEAFASKNE